METAAGRVFRAAPACAARGARFVRVSFFGASCASAFAAFFAFSGFAPSAFSALFRVVRGRFAGFGIGSEIFPMNAVRRSRDLPDPVHCITTIYHICIDVSFQRVIIKIDERGILHEHL